MNKSDYRIVFKGEIFPGYDKQVVIKKLKALCKYNDEALTRLFSGKTCIIKDHIEHRLAQKYKEALEETGVICHIQESSASFSRRG